MSGLTLRRSKPAQSSAPERDPRMCSANGCPFRGSVDRGNSGRFVCLCHDGKEPRTWPAITSACNENAWLGDFIADIRRMTSSTEKPATDWVQFATQFWQGIDDACIPTRFEQSMPSVYVYRMLAELRFRVGVTKVRPEPNNGPKAVPVRRGNLSELVGVEA